METAKIVKQRKKSGYTVFEITVHFLLDFVQVLMRKLAVENMVFVRKTF